MSNLNNNTQQLELLLQKVNELPDAGSGGIDTSDATATQNDILSGKTAYVDGEKITGTIATKTSSNLTASGATVTVPAGYYASQATKSVSSGSAKTPATTITKNPTISVNSSGVITASVSGTQNVTPTVTAGYVSSGTAGTITVNGSTTQQLTTQAAKTITPSTSSQIAVAKNVYTTGEITVNPIPSDYIVTDEITTQDSLISQIQTALQGKAAGGGTSGGIEFEFITIPAGATSATYTLPRITNAYGCMQGFTETESVRNYRHMIGIRGDCFYYISDLWVYDNYANVAINSEQGYYSNGTITWYGNAIVTEPIEVILINDPNEPAISDR